MDYTKLYHQRAEPKRSMVDLWCFIKDLKKFFKGQTDFWSSLLRQKFTLLYFRWRICTFSPIFTDLLLSSGKDFYPTHLHISTSLETPLTCLWRCVQLLLEPRHLSCQRPVDGGRSQVRVHRGRRPVFGKRRAAERGERLEMSNAMSNDPDFSYANMSHMSALRLCVIKWGRTGSSLTLIQLTKSSDWASSARALSLLRSSLTSSSSCRIMVSAWCMAALRFISITSIISAWECSMEDTNVENRQMLPAISCSTASWEIYYNNFFFLVWCILSFDLLK